MEFAYKIFSPFINFIHKFVDYNDEIYAARLYKKLVARGDEVTQNQIDIWNKYRFHPAVIDYKW